MDEKSKYDEITEQVSLYCNTFLDAYYRDLALCVVGRLHDHPDNPLKRGKINIWAASILCAISQFTPMFDKHEKYHSSMRELCYFFQVKEVTAYSKARKINKMLGFKRKQKVWSL